MCVCAKKRSIFFNIYITKTTKIVCDSHSHHQISNKNLPFFEIRKSQIIGQKSRISQEKTQNQLFFCIFIKLEKK